MELIVDLQGVNRHVIAINGLNWRSMSQVENRILELKETASQHNHLYYNLAAPIISDKEFDMMMKELEGLENENPQFDDPFSVAKSEGDRVDGFEKVKHVYPMLSLSSL